ncbi:MAG TPA: hypothetical protein V6D09_12510 [Leptolyngbyaceae cyanobacterium]
MPKLPLCDRCLFCAHDYHVVCALHPSGIDGDSCLDFRLNPELEGKHFKDFLGLRSQRRDDDPYSNPHELEDPDEELWEPAGASYYNGELVLQEGPRWTREEQMDLLDTHPMFTGKCPQCNAEFGKNYTARVHWDCPECGWMDDTV